MQLFWKAFRSHHAGLEDKTLHAWQETFYLTHPTVAADPLRLMNLLVEHLLVLKLERGAVSGTLTLVHLSLL